jgi:hypothetical protein
MVLPQASGRQSHLSNRTPLSVKRRHGLIREDNSTLVACFGRRAQDYSPCPCSRNRPLDEPDARIKVEVIPFGSQGLTDATSRMGNQNDQVLNLGFRHRVQETRHLLRRHDWLGFAAGYVREPRLSGSITLHKPAGS